MFNPVPDLPHFIDFIISDILSQICHSEGEVLLFTHLPGCSGKVSEIGWQPLKMHKYDLLPFQKIYCRDQLLSATSYILITSKDKSQKHHTQDRKALLFFCRLLKKLYIYTADNYNKVKFWGRVIISILMKSLKRNWQTKV